MNFFFNIKASKQSTSTHKKLKKKLNFFRNTIHVFVLKFFRQLSYLTTINITHSLILLSANDSRFKHINIINKKNNILYCY